MMRILMVCFGLAWLLPLDASPSANTDAALAQAIRLFADGQYQESQPLLEQLLVTHPDNATAHYYLGRIYLHSGDFDKAITHCKISVDRQAKVAEHHFCLGLSYGEKARQAPFWMQAFLAPKIRQAFETAVALDPNHGSARVGLTHFYMRAPLIMGGSLTKAQEQAEQLRQLKHPQAQLLLQDILGRQHKAISTNAALGHK